MSYVFFFQLKYSAVYLVTLRQILPPLNCWERGKGYKGVE